MLSLLSFHGERGGDVEYLRGKLVIGPWSEKTASLIVKKADISHSDVAYDLAAFRRALAFHEGHVRKVCFSSAVQNVVVPSGRYCPCFDCVSEIVTYRRYAACVACATAVAAWMPQPWNDYASRRNRRFSDWRVVVVQLTLALGTNVQQACV